jgi:AbrB family looped-hinge helix DNA binding protein
MYICYRIYIVLARIVKLQRVGNSIRATIPREVAHNLSLKEGEDVIVDTRDNTVIIKKKTRYRMAQFYGRLAKKTGAVKHWPAPEEIKKIWE